MGAFFREAPDALLATVASVKEFKRLETGVFFMESTKKDAPTTDPTQFIVQMNTILTGLLRKALVRRDGATIIRESTWDTNFLGTSVHFGLF